VSEKSKINEESWFSSPSGESLENPILRIFDELQYSPIQSKQISQTNTEDNRNFKYQECHRSFNNPQKYSYYLQRHLR
jgi:hypothetical protein